LTPNQGTPVQKAPVGQIAHVQSVGAMLVSFKYAPEQLLDTVHANDLSLLLNVDTLWCKTKEKQPK